MTEILLCFSLAVQCGSFLRCWAVLMRSSRDFSCSLSQGAPDFLSEVCNSFNHCGLVWFLWSQQQSISFQRDNTASIFVPFQDSGVWTLPSPSFGRRSSQQRTQTTSSRRWWRVWTTWNCRITPASRSCARNCWLLLARASSLSICLDLTSCTLTQNGLQSTHCRTTQIVTSSFRVALPLSFPPFSFLFFKHPHWGKICTAYLFKEKQLAETKQ